MNTNTNIKQGYKQTSLGILPQEWEVVRLGEVCEINPNSKKLPHEFYYIDLESVKNGKLLYKNKICKDKAPSRAQRILAKQDILFQLVRPYQRNNLFFDLDDICVASTGYAQIRTNENPFFIFQYLHTTNFVSRVLEHCTGSNYPAINSSDLSNLQIPLPPLAEQEKIAQILGVWDKGISVLKSLIEAKTKRKKALMQRLLTPPCESLTPSLRASETSAAIYNKSADCHDLTASNLAMTEKNSKAKQSLRFAEFTDKWQEMRLGDICEITTGSLNANAMVESGKFAFFTCAREVYAIDNYAFDTEALLVSGNGANVGYIHYYKGKFNAYQRTYVLDKFSCDILFVKFFLDKYLKKRIAQEKNEGNTPYIVLSTLQDMKIVLPNSLAEQKKIAQVLSVCDKEIELLKSKFQCLKTQKKGLMQRLLNGEVRVKC